MSQEPEEFDDENVVEGEDGDSITEAENLGVPVTSILEDIRKTRDESLENETVKFHIPTWDGDLVAEYRLLPRKLVETLGKKSGKGDMRADMDFIARSCVGIYANNKDLGTLIPIRVGGNSAGPEAPLVRYTEDLTGLLGKEDLKDPYKIIRYMFKNNEVAIGTHAARIFTWMTDPSAEVDSALEGN